MVTFDFPTKASVVFNGLGLAVFPCAFKPFIPSPINSAAVIANILIFLLF
jgi:hypothetical protein